MENHALRATGPVSHGMVTTALEIPGYKITSNLGVVRGLVVRSRSVIGNFGAGIQMLFGGRITLFQEMCDTARRESFEHMLERAGVMGANAIICVRYDATEVMQGATEVLAYGTAVWVDKA